MDVFVVPVDGRYVVYRPLLPLAFVGNRAMADLALRLAADPAAPAPDDARRFLADIGFLRPDPPEPPPPRREWQPTTAVVLLTNRCNLRCTYCYANAGVAAPHDTSASLATAAIDVVHGNARATGAPRFTVCFHGGGEPMRAWGVMRAAAEHARAKDLPCELTMVSNGVWSHAQRAWALATLDGVTISIDGGPTTQDSQRPLASGRASSRFVLDTIRALDDSGHPYGIRMTATAPFSRFADDVRYLCEHTGCREFQVEPAFNTVRGSHRQSTPAEGAAFAAAFVEAYDVAARAGRRLTYSGARPWLRTRQFCTAPWDALIVNADGHLVTCYEIADESHWLAELSTVGRLGEDATTTLDATARCRLLDHLESRHAAQCRDCFCRWHCAGDCYTRSSTLGEDGITATAERCEVNRTITAQLLLRGILASGGVAWRGEPVPAWCGEPVLAGGREPVLAGGREPVLAGGGGVA